MKLLVGLLCVFVIASRGLCLEVPLVHIENGAVSGTYKLSTGGNRFLSFEGIPYARPPVGKYRFREPQLLKPWIGVWNASSPGSDCLQYDHMTYLADNPFLGDEDCLYLNVYSPQLFSYVDGISGFLSTGDEIVPGNNGLKDQVAALKWIQRNIAKFGGNPANVMLTGMSAGGASVHYHYLSPLSQGLFHKGHSMSGSVLLPWTQAEELRKKTEDLATLLGCPVYTSKEIIDCLRHRPAKKIVELVKTYFMPWHFNPYTPFGPTVEVAGVAPFLDQDPHEAMEQGNVKDLPWIASVTSEEGLYPVSNFVANSSLLEELENNWEFIAPYLLDYNLTVDSRVKNQVSNKIKQHYLQGKPISPETFRTDFVANSSLLEELENNWEFIAPYLLDYNLTVDSRVKNQVSNKIKQHYLQGKPISPETTLEFTHMVGDRLFVEGVEAAAKLQAKAVSSPVYFYRFSYRGKHSLSEIMSFGSLENFGVSHGDDTGYVIKVNFMNPLETEEDKIMNSRMLDLWTSFAKTGVPSFGPDVNWSPLDASGELKYLQIDGPNSLNNKLGFIGKS
ncbi:venom carboxylesterase-6-like [Diaphorina citri]|uniref:Carboxylic ester hydrolase n=1 Tax=Diaphorina citri TaxID=121845 RepID=A0A3Q0JHH4_DIACI|nr:venom carboxylesterase-6-like [Diaphorina citri]